jgi:hypothetical protein
MPPKTRIMNPALQRVILIKKFKKFNPSADPQEVDFDAHIDNKCNLNENLNNFKENYTQFEWDSPEVNESNFNKNWRVQNIDGGEEFYTTAKVKLCKQGKYTYAKIQVTTPENLVGLTAHITIFKTNPETKPEQATPDNGLSDEFLSDIE